MSGIREILIPLNEEHKLARNVVQRELDAAVKRAPDPDAERIDSEFSSPNGLYLYSTLGASQIEHDEGLTRCKKFYG